MVIKREDREEILQYLTMDRYTSGEKIAKNLGLTRTSVWKGINRLRQKGFIVEAHPKKGYILKGYPDRLYPFVIKMKLNNKLFGRKIFFFQDIDSTNRLAKKLAMEGEEEGAIIIAEYQREGKGRLNRQWIMPQEKGILFSVIFRPKLFPNEAFRLTMLTSVAIAKAIKQELGLDSWIKWPNDIYIRDKKISGILTEFSAEQDQIRYAIVGAGIN
ncbi:MAG: biotin--[acetyl-CoA-carboxylase] ligase, partial [bacterium]|nr:biotin--[acetyl-CoA-carboxylase] ligase [bacterium]